jgi:hypothetical protein
VYCPQVITFNSLLAALSVRLCLYACLGLIVTIFLFIYCFFTIYSRYLKRVISKRDGCEYLKQVPSIDGSLELILWDPLTTFCCLLPISGFRSLISWLLFCAVRFLWFFAYVLMTSVTYGMLKSLCKVMFDMYQGAWANFLNVLDWNVWRIFVLEGLLHPHSSIP